MGFTLFGEKYKYEVDSINIGIFCPDGTLLIVLKLKDGTYKSIDVNLGAENISHYAKRITLQTMCRFLLHKNMLIN